MAANQNPNPNQEAQSRRTIHRILTLPPSGQDFQLAYQLLNMHATQANPNPPFKSEEEFITAVNQLLWEISPVRFSGVAGVYDREMAQYRAGTATRKILDAIRTIGSFQNEYWPPYWATDYTFNITATDDRPIDANAWHLLDIDRNGNSTIDDKPLALDAFNNHVRNLDGTGDDGKEVWEKLEGPSRTEVGCARAVRAFKRLVDGFMRDLGVDGLERGEGEMWRFGRVRCNGFVGVECELSIEPVMGDGNCYWYAVSQSLFNDWRRFAKVKADIRKYFHAVLTNPKHQRFRTYWILQRDSCMIDPELKRGTFSLLRCLHNSDHAGRATWRPQNHLALNQVIADYYHAEVIEFEDPGNWRPAIDDAERDRLRSCTARSADGNFYVARVRGLRDARRQVLLFKSGGQVNCGRITPRLRLQWGRNRFPTGNVSDIDRWEAMPWYTTNAQGQVINMPAQHLPAVLSPASGFNLPINAATLEEQQYVLANRNYPGWATVADTDGLKFISQPCSDDEMNNWNNQIQPPPYPGMNRREVYDTADGPDNHDPADGANHANDTPPRRKWLFLRRNRDTGYERIDENGNLVRVGYVRPRQPRKRGAPKNYYRKNKRQRR